MLGIFDSGLGGLTSVKVLRDEYPSADFNYLGDTARTPYGDKSANTVCEYAKEDADFLINKGATDIAIACNIASAVALDKLRSLHPEVNFYGVIEPTVATVVAKAPQRIGVLGTRATINSGVYAKKLKTSLPSAEVVSIACPLFVPWVEEGFVDYPETNMVIAHYLEPLRHFKPEIVILGCTHYPFLEKVIQDFLGPEVTLVSSSRELINSLPMQLLEKGTKRQKFYFTDLALHTVELANRWLGEGIEIDQVKL